MLGNDLVHLFTSLESRSFKQSQVVLKEAIETLHLYDKYRREKRWKDLLAHSKSLLLMSERVLNQYILISKEIVKQEAASRKLDALFSEIGVNLAHALRTASPSKLSELKEALNRRLKSSEKTEKIIKRFRIITRKRSELTKAVIETGTSRLTIMQRLFIIIKILHGHILFFSSGYLSTLQKPGRIQSQIREGTRLYKKINVLLEQSHQYLIGALSQTTSLDKFHKLVIKIESSIKPIWMESGPSVRALLIEARGNTDGDTRRRIYRLTLDIAEALRRLEIIQAYIVYCCIRCKGYDVENWYRDEIAAARLKKYESDVPIGTDRNIIDLIRTKSRAKKHLIRVEGEVKNLKIVQDVTGKKFSSVFTLVNPADHTEFLIRAHMFSLKNNGLINGAYCRLNGYVDPVGRIMDIDRITLSVLRQTSWFDDITYRMKPYSKLYPDEMNMFFTPPFTK